MDQDFFTQPILNSPYEYPARHWELDKGGQPTSQIMERRREVSFITPIPKARKQRAQRDQQEIVFDDGVGVSTQDQQYDPTPIINLLRQRVDEWRAWPSRDWRVTPETARLLEHWRHHKFQDKRPFFCQIEAAETAIWLTEVAPKVGKNGKQFLDHLTAANEQANPELLRLALKLATGAGGSGPNAAWSSCSRSALIRDCPRTRRCRSSRH